MILIGSQALSYYVPLERKLHDYDFIATEYELDKFNLEYGKHLVKTTDYSLIYDIDGTIVEIRNPKYLDQTDLDLLISPMVSVSTMFGLAHLPDIQTLYDIKKSTALCMKEHKHLYDLKLIEDEFDVVQNTEFFNKRLEETQNRTKVDKKNKYDFFHKYDLPEYVVHDKLHEMVADLLDLPLATYIRTITGSVTTVKELYDKLTHEQKVSLMVEESIVLSLERWLIPQMIENGINHRLIDMFYNNNEAMPTYHILKHVNLKGLKGEADYVVNFGTENFFEIEKAWIVAKEKIRSKGGFPGHFFDELFDLRKRYLAGENVRIG